MPDRKQKLIIPLVILMILFSAFPTLGQGEAERIKFKKGITSVTLRGRILGYDTKDYLISAKAGQVLKLRLSSRNSYTYFVIYSINGRPTDMNETTDWSERLGESGDYLIRVFMLRAGARRRGAAANYTLNVSIQ